MRRSRLRLVLLPIALATSIVAVALGVRLARGGSTLGEVQIHSYPAPDFALTQFDGQRFSLSAERGHVVLINFWASWCIPCQQEAPILQKAWNDYRDEGVIFVGVDIKDTPDDARRFLERYDVTYPNGFDSKKEIYIDYGVYGLPETFVVSPEGLVLHHVIGPTTRAEIDGWLTPFTKAAATSPDGSAP